MAPGRPTKYKKEYARMAYTACAESGMTHKALAKMFGVSERVIYDWKKNHPDFLHALEDGKDHFDSLTAEQSLLKRALGYRYTEKISEPDENGEMRVVKMISKQVPPETAAIKFWLTNRAPHRWKHRRQLEVSGPDGGAIEIDPLRQLMNQIDGATRGLPNKFQEKLE